MNNPFPPKTGKQDTAQARNARAPRPEAQTARAEQRRTARPEIPPRLAFPSLTDEDIQRAEWEGMTSNKPCMRHEDDYIPRSSTSPRR
jgi:hypothetical protein